MKFLLIGVSISSILIFPIIHGISVYNDLLPLYENSQEANDSSERLWLLLEDIQGLASFLIKNVSQICPLNQTNYIQRVEKIVFNTLSEIYENEETLLKNTFYENIIPPVRSSLEKCLNSSKSKLSLGEYSKQEYPETILHLDLKDRSDITKWQDFRPCIRTQIKSSFYPGTIPSIIDTLWQSFLLGYLGCSNHWGSIKEWNFLDLVQQVIIRPLFQRWSTKFPTKTVQGADDEQNDSTASTISSEIINVLSQNENNNDAYTTMESISAWLEKCNVILFLRHTVDPIPCFRDVIYSSRG